MKPEGTYWGSGRARPVLSLSPDACGLSTAGPLSGLTSRLLSSRKPSLAAPAHMVFPLKFPKFTALTGCNLFQSLSAEACHISGDVLCGESLPSYINRGK